MPPHECPPRHWVFAAWGYRLPSQWSSTRPGVPDSSTHPGFAYSPVGFSVAILITSARMPACRRDEVAVPRQDGAQGHNRGEVTQQSAARPWPSSARRCRSESSRRKRLPSRHAFSTRFSPSRNAIASCLRHAILDRQDTRGGPRVRYLTGFGFACARRTSIATSRPFRMACGRGGHPGM